MKQEDTKENDLTERVQFANKLQDELEKEYGVTMADCIYDYGNNSEKIKERRITMTELEKKAEKYRISKRQEIIDSDDFEKLDYFDENVEEAYIAGAKENESKIEILQKQKSKLIDMVKQLMSYELPNTDFGYTYQQDCFKAAKKLLEELK